jgi:putative FmdB family regulatory protein
MPIYEYECKKCRSRFEKKGSFNDKPEASCPHCQGQSKRIMSVGAVIYKGSGFYITDQRKQKDIADIGKPSKELAEKYPQFSGLDKSTPPKTATVEKPSVSEKTPASDKTSASTKSSEPDKK